MRLKAADFFLEFAVFFIFPLWFETRSREDREASKVDMAEYLGLHGQPGKKHFISRNHPENSICSCIDPC